MSVFTLMSHHLCFLLRTQRTPLLFILVLLLVFHLLIVCISLLRILEPLPVTRYFPLSLYSYNSYTRLHNHYIVLGILLVLRNAVERMLNSLQRISLRSVLSLITLGMHILSFSLFSSRTLQTLQILLPYLIHSGSAQQHSKYRVKLYLAPR